MSTICDLGPDPVGEWLNTGYHRFSSATGITGLCKVAGKRLDLLAVDAMIPGRGQFREFIKRCKDEFETICVWVVWNEILPDALARYGFKPEREVQGSGEVVEGFRWDKYEHTDARNYEGL